MNYETVELEEKVVAGFSDVTSNDSPDMGAKIGALWQKLYSGTKVSGRIGKKAIGLYCDYGKPGKNDYTVLAGFQVEDAESNPGLSVKRIPAGRYAKFTVHGDMVEAVGKAWADIWNTPLERTFTGDFEEYQEDCASPDGKGTIFIYLAIK